MNGGCKNSHGDTDWDGNSSGIHAKQSENICALPIADKELATDVLLVWRNEELSAAVESFLREF